MRFAFPVFCLALTFAPVALAALRESHPFEVRDLVAFDRIGEPTVSPDGRQIVFTLSSVDLDANKRRSDLWLVGVDGTGLRKLTHHDAADTSAVFASDGKAIYFLSTRSGSAQFWKLGLDASEPTQVTNSPLDVGSFALSPDGTKLALSMEVFPRTSVEATKKRLDDNAARKSTGKI